MLLLFNKAPRVLQDRQIRSTHFSFALLFYLNASVPIGITLSRYEQEKSTDSR
jgi:hypothetical protein